MSFYFKLFLFSNSRYYNAKLLRDKARYLSGFFELVRKNTNFIGQTDDEIKGKCRFDRNSWLFILDKVDDKK